MHNSRADINTKLLREKRREYPFEYLVQKPRVVRPEVFGLKYPTMHFACIPLPEGQYWLFKTIEDKTQFIAAELM